MTGHCRSTLGLVPVDQPVGNPVRQSEPDVRPLGLIAVGFAVLSLVLAPSYFFSLFTYLLAAPALVLGLVARKDEPIRKLGTAAVALAIVAVLVASGVLVWP
jgi:hypothetical protein